MIKKITVTIEGCDSSEVDSVNINFRDNRETKQTIKSEYDITSGISTTVTTTEWERNGEAE